MSTAQSTPARTARTARTGAVAAALGLSEETVRAYSREGRIPTTLTPGGHYRFDIAEVRSVLYPVALSSPEIVARFGDPFSQPIAVSMAAVAELAEEALAAQARTGFHRDELPSHRVVAAVAPAVAAGRLRQRHTQAARGVSRLLAGSPVAAFTVLR